MGQSHTGRNRLTIHQVQMLPSIPEGKRVPDGYQQIPLLWTFAVKYDGQRRARCVAGGQPMDKESYRSL